MIFSHSTGCLFTGCVCPLSMKGFHFSEVWLVPFPLVTCVLIFNSHLSPGGLAVALHYLRRPRAAALSTACTRSDFLVETGLAFSFAQGLRPGGRGSLGVSPSGGPMPPRHPAGHFCAPRVRQARARGCVPVLVEDESTKRGLSELVGVAVYTTGRSRSGGELCFITGLFPHVG